MGSDPRVRELVAAKLSEIGGDPKKFEGNLPRFPESGVVIKNARLKDAENTRLLGNGRSGRHVKTGSNHHVEIYALVDNSGRDKKWDGDVLPMFDAYLRVKEHLPVVQKDHGPEKQFRLALARGEVVECDGGNSQRSLFVVQKISQFATGRIEIALADPRDAGKEKQLLRIGPNGLLKLHARKVAVSPLGEVSEAHD